jgi:hypothetical protein
MILRDETVRGTSRRRLYVGKMVCLAEIINAPAVLWRQTALALWRGLVAKQMVHPFRPGLRPQWCDVSPCLSNSHHSQLFRLKNEKCVLFLNKHDEASLERPLWYFCSSSVTTLQPTALCSGGWCKPAPKTCCQLFKSASCPILSSFDSLIQIHMIC